MKHLNIPRQRRADQLLVDGLNLSSVEYDPYLPQRPEDIRYTISFDGHLREDDDGFRRALELDRNDGVAPFEIRFTDGVIWRCSAKFVVLCSQDRWRIMVIPLTTPTAAKEEAAKTENQ